MADNSLPRQRVIPLDQIEVDPDNVRTFYDPEEIAALRLALSDATDRGDQFINAPHVYRIGPDRYRTKHGNKRVMAAAGVLSTIAVVEVEPPPGPTEKILDQMSENVLQGGLSPMDIGRAVKRLRQLNPDWSLSMLAEALRRYGVNYDRATINRFGWLTQLSPGVQDMVDRKQLGFSLAIALRQLPGNRQLEVARQIVDEGLTRTAVERLVEAETGQSVTIPSDSEAAPSPPAPAPPSSVHDMLSTIDAGNVEIGQRQLDEALQRMTDAHLSPSAPRQAPDPTHRAGPISRRVEFLPLVEPPTDEKVQVLDVQEWTQHASERQKILANEALRYGKLDVADAIQLAEALDREYASVTPELMSAMNAVRYLVEHSDLVRRGPAFLRLLQTYADFLQSEAA